MPWHPDLIDSEIFSVHAALVPGGTAGKVVMLGGSEHNPAQGGSDETPADPAAVDRCAIYDVAARADAAKIDSPTTDVFCAGHAFTADGRLLIAGGTAVWGGDDAGGPGGGHVHQHGNFGGHRACWLFNQDRETWDRVADLRFDTGPGKGGGRWYPTVITLPSGDIAAFGGHPSRLSEDWHENDLPERYWSAANTWTWYPNHYPFEYDGSLPGNWYPRGNLVTGGDIFFTSRQNGKCRFFDPDTGIMGPVEVDPPTDSLYANGWNYATIALPLLPGDQYRSRIMAVDDVTPRFIELDLGAGTPAWQQAGSRTGSAAGKQRVYSCPVYLPTGQILMTGGIDGRDDTDAVLEPELFTPNVDWAAREYEVGDIGTWQTIDESAQKARNYHSVALLLPDGTVFVAGSNIDGDSGDPATVAQRNIEIYEPAYVGNAGRDMIASAPDLVPLDAESFSFTMGSAAEAAAVRTVALVRCGSVTHSGDFDQRYVALNFDVEGSTVLAVLPVDASVTPPGYYMLWTVDDDDLPCELAPIVRLGHVACEVVADRSTFSQEEVESVSPAAFSHALYAVFDGFRPGELPSGVDVELRWTDTDDLVADTDIDAYPAESRWLEHHSTWTEVGQRVTYPFTVEFRDPSLFDDFGDRRSFRATFTARGQSCSTVVDLVKNPNPYLIDIDPAVQNPHWLSTDIRTFRIREGQTMLGNLTHGSGDGAPEVFGKALIDKFRSLPNNAGHPFLGLPREGDNAAVDLAPTEGGDRVFNWAVAKVRYRATTTTAQQVKVFFRLFSVAATGLEYNPATVYRNAGTGATTVPALGVAGTEVASIPCFLSPRVNTVSGQAGATSMADQPLAAGYEVQDIVPTAGQEVTAYFACWLDVNQPGVKRFPLVPGGGHGPWPEGSARSIQELVRGAHQCLVAEVFFEPDPTSPGATPANADNLSQRNLALLHADNPGAPGSRCVVHPFEVRPSRGAPPVGAAEPGLAAAAFKPRVGPDELLIDWHNLPRNAEVTFYFSNIDTADIVQLAALTRRSRAPMAAIDDKTIRFTVGNHTWLPVPGGTVDNIPALLAVQLPATITSGEHYRISIHQVDGRSRRVIGSVDFAIPVSKANLLLAREARLYSVMQHVGLTIPSDNRWYPLFLRYLAFLGDRVDGFGGDSGTIHPNPDGSGRAVDPDSGERPPDLPIDLGPLVEALERCCKKIRIPLWLGAGAVAASALKGKRCRCGRRVR